MVQDKPEAPKSQPVEAISPKKTMAKPMVFGQWNGEPYNREEIKAVLWQEWH